MFTEDLIYMLNFFNTALDFSSSQRAFPRIFEFKFGQSCHHDTALAP